MKQTVLANPQTITRQWYVIDAEGAVLGRLSTQVASLLRGKGKLDFTPNQDCGDNVIVVNAEKIVLTGNKLMDKKYYRASGYPGGLKVRTAGEMLEKMPERIIEIAVKGMLPKNRIGADMFARLHVYAGADHEHQAQKPIAYALVK